MMDERQQETIKATGTNLVVLNTENLINDFASDLGYTPGAAKGSRVKEMDREAYCAGSDKGKEFAILENNMIT
jgi:hypothetical protein